MSSGLIVNTVSSLGARATERWGPVRIWRLGLGAGLERDRHWREGRAQHAEPRERRQQVGGEESYGDRLRLEKRRRLRYLGKRRGEPAPAGGVSGRGPLASQPGGAEKGGVTASVCGQVAAGALPGAGRAAPVPGPGTAWPSSQEASVSILLWDRRLRSDSQPAPRGSTSLMLRAIPKQAQGREPGSAPAGSLPCPGGSLGLHASLWPPHTAGRP